MKAHCNDIDEKDYHYISGYESIFYCVKFGENTVSYLEELSSLFHHNKPWSTVFKSFWSVLSSSKQSRKMNTFLVFLRLRLTARFKKFGHHHHLFNAGKPRRVWLQVMSTQYLWVMRKGKGSFQLYLGVSQNKNQKKKKNNTPPHFSILDAFPVCVHPKVPSYLFTPSRSPSHPA